ncbi:tetratricopeptide repeat protein, partial [candidate division KSB1 bacterium]|nr:tetratricopeptide repeat protein [candidate division KSB1 bacterium]
LIVYRQALEINRQLQRPEGIASDLGNIGIVYRIQGKLDSALIVYRQSLNIERQLQRPEGMGISFFNMGLLFEQQANYKTAAAYFDSAHTVFSFMNSPHAENAQRAFFRMQMKQDIFFLGHVYLDFKLIEEALTTYRDSLKAHPDSLEGYLHIASVFSQTGTPDSVVANYRRALDKKPDYDRALNKLAWHYAMRNENLQEALRLSKQSLQYRSTEPNYWDTLAEIYYRLARYHDAKASNEKARTYASDESLLKSIAERGQKIAMKLKEKSHK